VSVMIDSEGTGIVDDAWLEAAVRKVFRLTPSAIIETLELARPIYRQTAAYGHFGRSDIDLPWERCDRIEALKSALVTPRRCGWRHGDRGRRGGAGG
jgi:S-adenosylmethionine synthetase